MKPDTRKTLAEHYDFNIKVFRDNIKTVYDAKTSYPNQKVILKGLITAMKETPDLQALAEQVLTGLKETKQVGLLGKLPRKKHVTPRMNQAELCKFLDIKGDIVEDTILRDPGTHHKTISMLRGLAITYDTKDQAKAKLVTNAMGEMIADIDRRFIANQRLAARIFPVDYKKLTGAIERVRGYTSRGSRVEHDEGTTKNN